MLHKLLKTLPPQADWRFVGRPPVPATPVQASQVQAGAGMTYRAAFSDFARIRRKKWESIFF
jgi:hypothetical protein